MFGTCSTARERISGLYGQARFPHSRVRARAHPTVASIGKIASPSQGVGCFERDGYYARDDGAHREASAWAGRGAAALGLSGPVDPERFRAVLEGEVPGGRRLGRKEIDGTIAHRPGCDATLSAPKSVSLVAMVGGDERIVERSRAMPARARRRC